MEAAAVSQSRLMGALLVEKQLITDDQLEQALVRQEETGERLGEILVAEFGVARLQLAEVLAEQWMGSENHGRKADLELVEPLTPAEVRLRRPLGELLVERGLVTPAQLEAALDLQRTTGARIGEILVEHGALSLSDLADVLAEQGFQAARVVDQGTQNAAPKASGTERGWSAEDRTFVAGLEERLRAVERTAGGTPWQEDLRLVASDIRAAISAVEERLEATTAGPNAELLAALEAVSARIDALESAPVSAQLDALRRELEEVKARPATADEIAGLRAELERLESLPDRAAEIPHLASEIAVLSTRLDELAGVGELSDRLEAVAGLAEVAQTGIAGLASRVEELAGLESRLDEVATRLPSEEVIEELRRAVESSAQQGVDGDSHERAAHIASLVARLDQLAARVDEVAAVPVSDLAPRIDVLSARVDEVAAAIPVVETDGLAARIELLEEGSRAGGGMLERLSTEIGELGSRTQERLDALAAGIPSPVQVDELRARLDQLAAVVEDKTDTATLDEIRARLEQVAAGAPGDAASLTLLETRVGELEQRVTKALPAEELHEEMQRAAESAVAGLAQALQERVDAIAGAVPGEHELPELRSRLDELAARPVEDHGLRDRVEELSARIAGLDAVEGTIADLRWSLEQLDGARVGDVAATGARLARLEGAIDSLDSVVGLEGRVSDLAAELERRPDGETLAGVVAELRAELAVLAEQPAVAGLGERLAELSRRIEAGERDGADRIGGLAEELNRRVGELGEELRFHLDELAARPVEDHGLRDRVEELSARLAGLDAVEGTIADLRTSLEQLDGARVGDVAATGARLARLEGAIDSIAGLEARIREGDDLADRSRLLAARLDGTESRLVAVDALEERVSDLAAELERRPDGETLAGVVAELRAELAVLAEQPAVAGLGERLAELSRRIEAGERDGADRIGGLAEELNVRVGGLAAELGRRIDEIEGRADGLVSRDEVAATAAGQAAWVQKELEMLREWAASRAAAVDHALAAADDVRVTGQQELAHRVDEAVGAIRADLDELAARPVEDHGLRDRVEELSARLAGLDAVEGTIADLRTSLEQLDGGLAEELNRRVGELGEELRSRLDELAGRADGLVSRDEAAATAARQAAWVQEEVEMLRRWGAERAVAVDHALAAADDARVTGQQELAHRVDEAVGAVRADLEAQGTALGAQLEANASETAALCARIDALHEAAAGRAAWEARLERKLEQRFEGLAARLTEEAAATRADTEQTMDAVRQETGSLGARIDELQGLRHADAQAARATSEQLAESVEALAGLRADDAEAARVAATDLSARLESLAQSLNAEAADGRVAIKSIAGKIDKLRGLRADDLAAAERAREELAARLDEHTMQSAATARKVEEALRAELADVAARLEERDAQGIEAREELRDEFERIASSVGWRLERIEESLAGEQWAQLETMVTQLAHRLDEQAAIGHEQARATERALRKGLATLGERLVDTESAYVDAGNALRRSIERLGAAVVEADARMADQIPVSEAEGCVAFAPTPAGYRLVELPGTPPEIGSTIELDVSDDPLVVTRYGRSPLPLDNRPCAYLDRA